jgi:hypothetical protein
MEDGRFVAKEMSVGMDSELGQKEALLSKITYLADRCITTRTGYQDALAQAFMHELGCKPSEIEIVQVNDGNCIRWFYRRKKPDALIPRL